MVCQFDLAAQYVADLRAIRATGAATAETAFYPPLDRLFSAVGQTLKPRPFLFDRDLNLRAEPPGCQSLLVAHSAGGASLGGYGQESE